MSSKTIKERVGSLPGSPRALEEVRVYHKDGKTVATLNGVEVAGTLLEERIVFATEAFTLEVTTRPTTP
jgi:hypothetical protein